MITVRDGFFNRIQQFLPVRLWMKAFYVRKTVVIPTTAFPTVRTPVRMFLLLMQHGLMPFERSATTERFPAGLATEWQLGLRVQHGVAVERLFGGERFVANVAPELFKPEMRHHVLGKVCLLQECCLAHLTLMPSLGRFTLQMFGPAAGDYFLHYLTFLLLRVLC